MGGGFSRGAGGNPTECRGHWTHLANCWTHSHQHVDLMAPGAIWWLDFMDIVRTSLTMSCEEDTSPPQGTAPVTSPGTGMWCQCPLTHSSILLGCCYFPIWPQLFC